MRIIFLTACLSLELLERTKALAPYHHGAPSRTRLFTSRAEESIVSTPTETASSSSDRIQLRDFFDRESWLTGFRSAQAEVCYELEDTDFPQDIKGTFFQNGHAKFKTGDEIAIHPFDADGMISALTFHGDGKAWFRNRFVETKGFVEELKANKILYRGVFGTAKNKGKWWSNIFDVKFKNVANTHVLYWKGASPDGRLFALWEGGMPHEIDPVTLETIGESDLDGTLKDLNQYAAHYKVDPSTGNICNFVVGPGENDPIKEHTLVVLEHSSNGELLYKESHPFPRVGLNHDCAITKNYFVFFQTSATVNPLPFILGQKGIGQSFAFDQEATSSTLCLIPRCKGGVPIEINIPKSFTFHTSNAFEDQDGTVVVDAILANKMVMASTDDEGYPDEPLPFSVDLETELVPYQLRRIRVDPKTREFLSEKSMTDAAKTVEFPMIHPSYVGKPYKFSYCGASPSDKRMSPIQGICKIDVQAGEIIEKWLPEPHCFLSELSFVPRTSEVEDDGYLVGFMLDGKDESSSLVIFDAKDIARGPIKMSKLKAFIPHALHGTFVSGFVPELTDRVKSAYPPRR